MNKCHRNAIIAILFVMIPVFFCRMVCLGENLPDIDFSNPQKVSEFVSECIYLNDMISLAAVIDQSDYETVSEMLSPLDSYSAGFLIDALSTANAKKYLSSLPIDDAAAALSMTSTVKASEIVIEMAPEFAFSMLHRMPAQNAANILSGIADPERIAAILSVGNLNATIKILNSMPFSRAKEVLSFFDKNELQQIISNVDSHLAGIWIDSVSRSIWYDVLDWQTLQKSSEILNEIKKENAMAYLWHQSQSDRNETLKYYADKSINGIFPEPGQLFTLGKYPQNDENPDPVKWILLDSGYGSLLMISQVALDCKPYNNTLSDVSWQTSSLRKWLNTDFFSQIFSEKEQDAVQDRQTGAGSDDIDKVFLLSIQETNDLLEPLDKMSAEPTEYAIKHGADTGFLSIHTKWWLRDSGNTSSQAAAVHPYGVIDDFGEDVDQNNRGIRPAISVNYSFFYPVNKDGTTLKDSEYEKIYRQAVENMQADYAGSLSQLRSISGYKDSDELVEKYGAELYKLAVEKGSEGDYEGAIRILNSISFYENSQRDSLYYSYCMDYYQALDYIKNDLYKNAVEMLSKTLEYGNSRQVLADYRQSRMQSAADFAEQGDYDNAINVVSVMDDYAPALEVKEIYVKEQKYYLAQKAVLEDDYETANSLLQELVVYRDCAETLLDYRNQRIERAKALADEKSYQQAYDILNPMTGIPAADQALTEIRKADNYDTGLEAIQNDDYAQAVELLTGLTGYKDSAQQLAAYKTDRIASAKSISGEGDYATAKSMLEEMADVPEAAAALKEVVNAENYSLSLVAIEKDDYETASVLLDGLSQIGYKDSYTQLTAYRSARVKNAKELAEEEKFTEAYAILEQMIGIPEADYALREVTNADKYKQLVAAVNDDDYEKTVALFADLPGYADTYQMKSKYQEDRVARAKEVGETGEFAKAYEILEPMTDVPAAQQLLSSLQKEENYLAALEAIDKDDYETANQLLTSIAGYKDSNQQLSAYRTKRINAAKLLAESQEYTEAYEILTPMAGFYEADTVLKDIRNQDKYEQAAAAIESDNYETASTLLTEIQNYKDSYTILYNYRNRRIAAAKQAAADNDYTNAYAILEPMSDYQEAVLLLNDTQNAETYDKAMAAVERDDYAEAIALFTGLGYYKDSASQIQQYRTARIKTAKDAVQSGDYETAYSILNEMSDYKEAETVSADLHNLEQYEKADALMALQKYPEAAAIFTELGYYKDSSTRLYQLRYQCKTEAYNGIKANEYDFAVTNVDAFDNVTFLELLSSLTQEEAVKYMDLLGSSKLKTMFANLDVSSRIRLLGIMGTNSAADFLNGVDPAEVATLFKSMAIGTAVGYLEKIDNDNIEKVLKTMDPSAASYYLNSMNPEDARSFLRSRNAQTAASLLEPLTDYQISVIMKDWAEAERITVLSAMDSSRPKNIYTILNLPKMAAPVNSTYYLKPQERETVEFKITGDATAFQNSKISNSNDQVVSVTDTSIEDKVIKLVVQAKSPGIVYLTLESNLGRVLSDTMTIGVMAPTPTPAPVQSYDYGGAGIVAGAVASGYTAPYSGDGDRMVLICQTGNKWHNTESCCKNGGGTWVTLSEAKRLRSGPCGRCGG